MMSTPHGSPSETNLLLRLARLRYAPELALSVFMLGFGLSIAMPYISLFGVKEAHMTPLQLGLFLTLNAVAAVGISTWLGKWSDRRPNRKPLVLLTMGAGLAAYLLLSVLRSYPLLVLNGMVLMGTAMAAFPQLFAFARTQLADAPDDLPERAVTVLRSVFSLAWVVGPGLGALILARWSFNGVFLATALCFVVAALPLLGLSGTLTKQVAAAQPQASPSFDRRLLLWVSLAFVLYGMSMNMGSTFMPLFVTETLHGKESQVGLLVGWCALLEIPAMLALVLMRNLPTTERLVKGALLLFAVHFTLIYLAHGLPLMYFAQSLRALVLAVTAGLGMLYFQELMPGRFAAATTLFANTTSIGSMLAGIVSGACAQWFGYRSVFLLCAALTFSGWVVMQTLVKRQSPQVATTD